MININLDKNVSAHYLSYVNINCLHYILRINFLKMLELSRLFFSLNIFIYLFVEY